MFLSLSQEVEARRQATSACSLRQLLHRTLAWAISRYKTGRHPRRSTIFPADNTISRCITRATRFSLPALLHLLQSTLRRNPALSIFPEVFSISPMGLSI